MRFEFAPCPPRFFGTVAVRCAFLLAVFGWGAGFYGPSIYLAEVAARTGWPLTLISAAVTVHFLFGALVAANLPRLHDRLGLGLTTAAGALMTAVGVFGWATAWQPWQLFVAALLSGAGWVAMGAVAVNAIVARWYATGRPAALARAYNGASLGGVIFSPLWVALIHEWGFPIAAAVVGCVMFLIVAVMSHLVFSRTPADFGLALDGAEARHHEPARRAAAPAELPRGALWRDRAFLTLAAGMAMGLFAQIGLLAHLFTLLTPALGAQATGFLVGGGTACAILGRAAAVRLLAYVNDRRL
ncbi:MAG TPA: MFS transporter, partial [Bordetella sp.]|nr:MFS transporter [Bordetella sp.]